jgi:hypothetical protein
MVLKTKVLETETDGKETFLKISILSEKVNTKLYTGYKGRQA